MTLWWIAQIGIVATGVTAHFANQWPDGSKPRKWAPVIGLSGQAFWLTFAFSNDPVAWGVVGLCIPYGLGWADGVRRQWFNKPGFETARRAIEAAMETPEPDFTEAWFPMPFRIDDISPTMIQAFERGARGLPRLRDGATDIGKTNGFLDAEKEWYARGLALAPPPK